MPSKRSSSSSTTPVMERIPLLINIFTFAAKDVKSFIKFANICSAWEESALRYGSPFGMLKIALLSSSSSSLSTPTKTVFSHKKNKTVSLNIPDDQRRFLRFYKLLFRAVRHFSCFRLGSFILNFLFSKENTIEISVTVSSAPDRKVITEVTKRGFRLPQFLTFPQMQFAENPIAQGFQYPSSRPWHRNVCYVDCSDRVRAKKSAQLNSFYLLTPSDLLWMRYGHKQENLLAIVTYNKDPAMFHMLMQKLHECQPPYSSDNNKIIEKNPNYPLWKFIENKTPLYEFLLFECASVFDHDSLHLLATAVKNNHVPTIKLWINDIIGGINWQTLDTNYRPQGSSLANVPFVIVLQALNMAIKVNNLEALDIILSCPNTYFIKNILSEYLLRGSSSNNNISRKPLPTSRIELHMPRVSIHQMLAELGRLDMMKLCVKKIPDFFHHENFHPLHRAIVQHGGRRNPICEVVTSTCLTEDEKILVIRTMAINFILPHFFNPLVQDVEKMHKISLETVISIFFTKTWRGVHPLHVAAQRNSLKLFKFLISIEDEINETEDAHEAAPAAASSTNNSNNNKPPRQSTAPLLCLLYSKALRTDENFLAKLNAMRKKVLHEINYQAMIPLQVAVYSGCADVVAYLLFDKAVSQFVIFENPEVRAHKPRKDHEGKRVVDAASYAKQKVGASPSYTEVYQLFKRYISENKK